MIDMNTLPPFTVIAVATCIGSKVEESGNWFDASKGRLYGKHIAKNYALQG